MHLMQKLCCSPRVLFIVVRRHSKKTEKKNAQALAEYSLYTFKGRIPLSQIEIENIEDGTGKKDHADRQ